MSQQQAIGFVTRKAPGRGYELSKIVGLDGELKVEVIAYRTTLPEIQVEEHRMKEVLFGEVAWYPPIPAAFQPPAQMHESPPADGDTMPHVVESYRNEGGLVGRLMGNGAARSLVPALFLAGAWLSFNLQRWGA